MKKNEFSKKTAKHVVLSAVAKLAQVTAKIGAGTASSWGDYQPTLPKELSR